MSVSSSEKIRIKPQTTGPQVNYLVRRETHSSRALTAIIVALVTLGGLIYFMVEAILALSHKHSLLATPAEMWQGITQIADPERKAIVTIIAFALVLAGLIILSKSVLPGALGRHSIKDSRSAYIVDDAVIASNISRQVRRVASLPTGHVTTAVAGRKITVQMTPLSGQAIDQTAIRDHLTTNLGKIKLTPSPKLDLQVSEEGKLAK